MVHAQLPIKTHSANTNNHRLLVHVVYCLFLTGFATLGLLIMLTFAAVFIIYIKRTEVIGTIYASHFYWLLKTFWLMLLIFVTSILLLPIYIGYLGIFFGLIWTIHRIVKGWLCLFDDASPIPFNLR